MVAHKDLYVYVVASLLSLSVCVCVDIYMRRPGIQSSECAHWRERERYGEEKGEKGEGEGGGWVVWEAACVCLRINSTKDTFPCFRFILRISRFLPLRTATRA